jgi:hypothetical protein
VRIVTCIPANFFANVAKIAVAFPLKKQTKSISETSETT